MTHYTFQVRDPHRDNKVIWRLTTTDDAEVIPILEAAHEFAAQVNLREISVSLVMEQD